MQANRAPSRGGVPPRVRQVKDRCRKVITLLPASGPITEEHVQRAIVELTKASEDLTTELHAMKVQRARAAKRSVPRGGLKDARGRRRGTAALPGYNAGRKPGNAGKTYGKTPPSTHEVLRMLELAPQLQLVRTRQCLVCHEPYHQPHKPTCFNPFGERMRALMYVLWRAGLRINCEALQLTEDDLYPEDGYIHVKRGKGGKSRDVAIDDWVWPKLEPWLRLRQQYPAGPLFCIVDGPTAGIRPWGVADVRKALHKLAANAKVRRRCAPHQLRHACAVDQLDDGVNILYLSRQLGHANLAITTTYLEGLPQSRVIKELRSRPVPKVSVLELLGAAGRGDSQPLHTPALERQMQAPDLQAPDLMGVLSR